jgi:peptidoglycan/xylan/chitin deacetylase (PgdA/CDA1 family)
MGFESLRRMAAEGLEIGSHSQQHAHLTRLSDGELERELVQSARDLERELGRRPRAFCYPYGDVDARVARAAAAHYELACTTELDILPPSPVAHRLPRLDAYYYRDAGRLERWGGTSFRAHLWLRRSARAVRARLPRA